MLLVLDNGWVVEEDDSAEVIGRSHEAMARRARDHVDVVDLCGRVYG